MTSLNKIAFRRGWSLWLLIGALVITVCGSAWGVSRVSANRRAAADRPSNLSELLNPDGTLNLSRGFQGNLNSQGFRMEYAENGAPRFVPAAPTVGGSWDTQFVNANGAHTFGYAVAVIGTDVYVGGAPLETAGNGLAEGVAKWNGSSWSALGSGVNGSVYALAAAGTDLYVAGNFSMAGGVSANNVARWNGSAWSALGSGVDGSVFALAVSGGNVYVGGSFSMAGGNAAANIARWNGSAWSALGSGTNQQVEAIAVSGSNVYAGGIFTMAGGNPANYVARWNGSAWSALGSGMDFTVNALAVSGTNVFAGGSFSTAGGAPANSIARWNGSAWSALGSGLLGPNAAQANVRSLLIIGEHLYAAGTIVTAGGTPANGIAHWGGGTWTALGNGLASGKTSNDAVVLSLAASGSDVYAAGGFTKSGNTETNGIAKWNGTTWSPLGSSSNSVNYNVYAVAVSGNDVYVGGEFDFAGGLPANNIAKWNGSAWSALGSGVNRVVRALAVSGTDVYAGGEFTTAGGAPASFVARWNGSAWSALGSGITNGVGVNALAVSGANLYAGGFFFTAGGNSVSNIARWNGSAWSALGSGTGGTVNALAVSGSDLYAGGSFTSPGAKVAKWNGSSWSALGTGITGAVAVVNALAVSGTDVYVGGVFGIAGGNSILGLAKWNGSAWSQLGSGLNGFVFSLLLSGSDLYVGGNFDMAGGTAVSGLAKWNGSAWTGLGASTGTNGFPRSFGLQGTNLFVGGTFTALSGTVSHYFGRFGCSAITLSPTGLPNGAVGVNYNQTLTASPAGSYTFSLINGSLPKGLTLSTGGVISGTPAEFGIFNFTVRANDGSCMGSRAYTLAVTGTACATPNFTNRADYTVGSSPAAIVTGDFNKDGKADLVTANVNSNNLTLLLGDGVGGFSTITSVAGSGRTTMTTGDFNGDGNLDLLLAATQSGVGSNATVRFGNGAGAFPTSTTVNFGVAQGFPQTGDFNGDGNLDFLVITGSTLQVRLGDGTGNFSVAPGSPLALGFASAGFTTLNDFNLDGKLDLAIAQDNATQVSVLFGAGDGSFAAGSPISVSSTPTNVSSADFNLDGSADLAVAHANDSLTILLGNGAGGFSPASGSPISGAAAFLPGDFNGDGRPDLAAANRVAYGNGSGGFTLLNGLDTGSDRRAVTFGDFNGDGKPDLAVVNAGPNRVVLVLNNCAPSIAAATALTRQQGSPVINSVIATVNDLETAAGSLTVTLTSPSPSNGVTLSNIVNTNGTITADIIADCPATNAGFSLRVSDGANTANATLNVAVSPNTAPAVTYANVSVNAGNSTGNSPTTATDNGSITGYAIQSQAGYTGTISVNAVGLVSISNAAPVGNHTIIIRATDNCGATTDAQFTLMVNNNAPTITPGAALTRQQGTAGSIATIATVNDGETPVGNLTVTATTVPTGIAVTSITNTAGTITANVAAGCNAAVGANTVVLTVTDGNNATATAGLTVTVTANTAPTLVYGNASVNAGSATTNSPTTATDNGNISSFAVQNQGGYTGTISVNASGLVSISNAAPVGNHTITIRATDNCGATTDAQFTLSIGNNLPTITPSAALTRQQGTAGSTATIATVSDNDTPPGNLVVTATNVPAGITITSIVNSGGTISANIAAGCNAAVGANSIGLTVTDANNGMATANLTVNVTANSAPSLSYPVSGVAMNAATTITPTTAGDNGSITGYQIVSVSPPLTVAPTVDSSGVVSVTNAAPFGLHTITVRATDNCGATTDVQFTLNVGCGSLTVTPATLINGLTFIPYSSTLSATGGSGTYTFSLASGTLPAGLNLSGNTISGTPNTAGASTFTIRATDDNGCFGEQSYTLLIGSTGLKYYPLARPVRLLDTRPGLSPNACFQPNAPIPGDTARLQPARGVCEGLTIPANATTITGNITTVQSGGGFLTIYPSDAPQPLVANSNYQPNEILNNAFTVGVGAKDGAVKIFVTSTTDVVIDVTGYYAPPEAGGLYFHPLPRPVRLLETRAGFTGCFAPAQPLPGGVNTIQQGTGSCQGLTIPPDALALVGNATTVNPVGEGYLTLYPANAAQPLVASSNYAAGQVVNGPFTVGLSPSGQFNIFTLKTTDLVVDITGYYSAQANDPNGQGLLFTSLGSPLRLLDTRAGEQGCYTPGAAMTTGTVYTQETQSPCTNLTPTARALIGNATVVNTTGEGYLTFWPADATQPLVATSNYVAGQVFNRYFTVGLSGSVSFKRFASRTTDLVIDISGFFAP